MYATVITTLARRLISQFFWNSLKVYLMIEFYFERGGMQIFKHNTILICFSFGPDICDPSQLSKENSTET